MLPMKWAEEASKKKKHLISLFSEENDSSSFIDVPPTSTVGLEFSIDSD